MADVGTSATQQSPNGVDGLVAALAQAWHGVLGFLPEEDSDFYDAGGTSMDAARIASLAAESAPDIEDLDVTLMTALLNEARFGDVRRLGLESIDRAHGSSA
ncbi:MULTISPECIES: phosphopantetheine-binding protein [Streptomyces]|uniref:phosphopantetheine-binding protein n=1 Tax=Streptomyces TaxID=1883 RepID=UPI001678D44D|nr:phosphopantetheine-binding protein [Streptomyces galilaeus]